MCICMRVYITFIYIRDMVLKYFISFHNRPETAKFVPVVSLKRTARRASTETRG